MIPIKPPEAPDIGNSKKSSEMIHDFITDLAGDRLPAKNFTSNKVTSSNNIESTDGKIKKVQEISGNLKSNESAGIDSESHVGKT